MRVRTYNLRLFLIETYSIAKKITYNNMHMHVACGHVISVLHMLHIMSVDSHHLDLVPQLTPRCHSDETWD